VLHWKAFCIWGWVGRYFCKKIILENI